jgi:acetylornithine deacetylase/succinyl-diaminopimelate desuccinylase-like protein
VDALERIDRYIEDHKNRFVGDLQRLSRLPSVSAQRQGLEETAEAVVRFMVSAGMKARLESIAGGAPVVIGEAGHGRPVLLIYDHYDVQPADPLNEWASGPFDPVERNGRIYARGVADNKGPLMARIQAVEAWLKSGEMLPLTVRFLVEGEEEIGSPHLGSFVETHRDELRADLVLWEGGGRDAFGRPMATLGYRGLAGFDLHVQAALQDAHSMFGGLVPNALWRLVWALGTIMDPNGRITIDGLWDHVRSPSAAELEMLEQIEFDETIIQQQFGVKRLLGGVTGTQALIRHLFEPACTINGISGGYGGPGTKTVLPAHAWAKLDLRLVPNLTPDNTADLLRAHLDRRGFNDVELNSGAKLHPYRTKWDHPLVRATIKIAETVYGADVVVYPTSPGSGPMAQVCGPLEAPGISVGGMNHPSVNTHGPNENIYIRDYLLGIAFTARLFEALVEH